MGDLMITMLKSKLHRAVVTEADVNYVGSITIDKDLMEKSGIYEYEKVSVVDVENGQRFDTYVIAGERGSRIICVNGAAARLVAVGDHVIIMAYKLIEEKTQVLTSLLLFSLIVTTILVKKKNVRELSENKSFTPLQKAFIALGLIYVIKGLVF